MWVNKQFFQLVIDDNKTQAQEIAGLRAQLVGISVSNSSLSAQKVRDDLTIDWLRHRVNALEKQNAVLLQKVAGVAMPTPEIVPTLPQAGIGFDTMPSFEDIGDEEAARLGVWHDDDGGLVYTQ